MPFISITRQNNSFFRYVFGSAGARSMRPKHAALGGCVCCSPPPTCTDHLLGHDSRLFRFIEVQSMVQSRRTVALMVLFWATGTTAFTTMPRSLCPWNTLTTQPFSAASSLTLHGKCKHVAPKIMGVASRSRQTARRLALST